MRDVVTEHVRVDDAVIDRGDPQEIIDPVWWTGNIYDGPAEYSKSLVSFTKEQRLIHAIIWYTAEVNNGGHDQFYSNSTGIVWKDALAGFREIGLAEAALVIEESAKRMGGNPSLDRSERQEQLDTLQPSFDDLDNRFYILNSESDLDAIMREYIARHREAFYFDGNIKKPKRRARPN